MIQNVLKRIHFHTYANYIMGYICTKRFKPMCMKRFIHLLVLLSTITLHGTLAAQSFPVTGKVSDASTGESLIGASIMIAGTNSGVVTDVDGTFSLTLERASTLSVSYLGYVSREIYVEKASELAIALSPDLDYLDEVVVIGYGSVRRKDLTGSVSQISSSQIQNASVPNVMQTLEGRIPGLQITPDSGTPGAGSTVLVHGKQSINGTNSPIYVIDGTISDGLNISPNDVETISVLKDASAVAIYGARAANGVIVVTTKRGSNGTAPTISFKTEHSLQQEGNLRLNFLNADEWVQLATEAYNNAGKDTPWTDADLAYLKGVDVDWPNVVKRNGYLTTNNLSVRGGSDRAKYFISLNQSYNQGIIKNQDYRRVALRMNGDYRISKRITFGHSVSIFSSGRTNQTDADGRDAYAAAFRYSPLNPIYDENGEYATIYNTSLQSKTPNPMWVIENTERTTKYKGAEGNLYLTLDLAKGLSFTTRASAKWENSTSTTLLGSVSPAYGFEGSSVNKVTKGSTDTLHWITDYVLNYDETFGGVHHLSAMLGYSAEKQTYESLSAARGGTPSNGIIYLDAGDPSTATNNNSVSEWSFLSQFGRLSYSYKDRYYLNGTVRRDGTSRLANNRYGVFPSVSVAWRIGEESFMDSADWIDELKLRASWGMVGNVLSIGTYGTSVYLSQQNAVLNESVTSGYSSINAVNTDLKWESTTKKDVGFDLSILGNRLYFVADVYLEDTHNLLFTQPIPMSTGLSGSPYINAGHVRNTGIDFEAGYRQKLGDWYFDANFNISHVKNRVIDLEGRDLTTSGIAEGYPIGCYYGYISDGINRTQQDVDNYPQYEGKTIGDIRFKDINGDGKVDTADRALFGKVFPDFTYGFVATISYKNLALQLQLNGVQGLDHYMLEGGYATDMFNNEPNVEADYVLNRFHPVNNPDGTYPRVGMGDPGRNQTRSDFWLVDASFLSLKNISLSYSFPKKMCETLGMGSMNAYVGSQNAYTFGNPYSVIRSTVNVPIPRILTVGFDVTF